MFPERQYKGIVVFTAVYVLLSFPPFLALNWEVVQSVYGELAPLDTGTVAIWFVAAVILVYGLLLAEEGIERYNQFLVTPTDALSVLVEFSFLVAAVSWWAVPELLFWLGWNPTLDQLLVVILACQVPMMLFFTLMTAAGKAASSTTVRG